MRAERRHVARGEFAPVAEHRRQRRADFLGAELQAVHGRSRARTRPEAGATDPPATPGHRRPARGSDGREASGPDRAGLMYSLPRRWAQAVSEGICDSSSRRERSESIRAISRLRIVRRVRLEPDLVRLKADPILSDVMCGLVVRILRRASGTSKRLQTLPVRACEDLLWLWTCPFGLPA